MAWLGAKSLLPYLQIRIELQAAQDELQPHLLQVHLETNPIIVNGADSLVMWIGLQPREF